MWKPIAFPCEKVQYLSGKEKELLAYYKQKEKESQSPGESMYYLGQIHAVYQMADSLYTERLKASRKIILLEKKLKIQQQYQTPMGEQHPI
ncbi:hypothetical protein [Sediminibacillus massiliensis]|uniref:hypothetical protein n=1 Tax=Sediminibacillus massiliensis TaxID=1926277 RepID=UPI0009885FCF|nr:hypothetical protein [Sediminibacillus massiliensis]